MNLKALFLTSFIVSLPLVGFAQGDSRIVPLDVNSSNEIIQSWLNKTLKDGSKVKTRKGLQETYTRVTSAKFSDCNFTFRYVRTTTSVNRSIGVGNTTMGVPSSSSRGWGADEVSVITLDLTELENGSIVTQPTRDEQVYRLSLNIKSDAKKIKFLTDPNSRYEKTFYGSTANISLKPEYVDEVRSAFSRLITKCESKK